MAYIKKEQVLKHIKEFYEQLPLPMSSRHMVAAFKAYITSLPTADVVEIPCRCNECKSFVENKEALVTYCTRECKNLTVKPSDFCSYGKRKEKNDFKE